MISFKGRRIRAVEISGMRYNNAGQFGAVDHADVYLAGGQTLEIPCTESEYMTFKTSWEEELDQLLEY